MSDSDGPPPRAVLDTDVIFSRVLHELFGRLATELRLLTLVWSDELLQEAERVLRDRKPMPPDAARRWVGYLRDSFPLEQVDIAEAENRAEFSELTIDPSDVHVCALAVLGKADLLLTFDQGFLKEPLSRRGVRVISPDDFLVEVFDERPSAFLQVLRFQADVWGGGRHMEALLDAITRAGAPECIRKVRATLGG